MSISTIIGVALLLLSAAAPDAGAQRGRLGVLRPVPRAGVGGRLRLGVETQPFVTTCIPAVSFPFFPFFPAFGGAFVNGQLFADVQPVPDPGSHIAPNPNAQPVPFSGSHALPGLQPVPEMEPVPGGASVTTAHSARVFATPVYSAPVYSAPTYAAAAPVAAPQVTGGMVVGDIIEDPSFGLWGSPFFFGAGSATCIVTTPFNRPVLIR
jgi:hypothetical protein